MDIKDLIDVLKKQHEEQMKAQEKQMKAQAEVQQKAVDALLGHLAEASTPAAPAVSVPSFTPFDPTSELWRQYLDRFTIFAGANSIPNEKLAHVFLTNQTSETYQLLDNLAGQQDPPILVKDLGMDQIQEFMRGHFDPARFVIQERYNYWSSPARWPGESLNELEARLRKAAATCDFPSVRNNPGRFAEDSFRVQGQQRGSREGLFPAEARGVDVCPNSSPGT